LKRLACEFGQEPQWKIALRKDRKDELPFQLRFLPVGYSLEPLIKNYAMQKLAYRQSNSIPNGCC
jgi:hypothetical protein